jgi:hypothetical protein
MLSEKKFKISSSCLLPAVVSLLCFVVPLIALGQGPVDPEDTPIDGGLGLLLAAGAAYGVKKYRDVQKLRKNNV